MTQPGTDPLSALAGQILRANPNAYEKLVVIGGTRVEARRLLDSVTPDQLLATPAQSTALQTALLAGLWLWHDGLEECHRIAQQSSENLEATQALAFWHAIMHRHEGDFSNSKYWYARVGRHPVLDVLANQAGSIVNKCPADKALLRVIAAGWSPAALVDLVETVHNQPDDPRRLVAVRLQQLEWRTLFDHCARG